MGGELMYGWRDVRMYGRDVQIPPVFYRTLSPPVPSGAAQRLAQASQRLVQASQRLVQASQRLAQAPQRPAQASQRLAQTS